MLKSLALTVLLAIVAFPVASSAQETDVGVRATFEVTVQSNFGTVFTDCFRFDEPGNFRLTVDGFGTPLLYRFGDLNKDRTDFISITRSASNAPFQITFFGNFGNVGRIRGQALNEFGNTFVFSGVRNESCPAALTGAGRNPYSE